MFIFYDIPPPVVKEKCLKIEGEILEFQVYLHKSPVSPNPTPPNYFFSHFARHKQKKERREPCQILPAPLASLPEL